MNTVINPTPIQDFRLFLQQTLLDRCRVNPSYSLRAFARSLGVAPSALSDMLNNKRPITAKMKQRLGLTLGLSPAQIDPQEAEPVSFQQITLDTFALISDWYHYAILELMKLSHFKGEAAWIAKTLGITRSEANAAIERLERLGMIEITPKGKWYDRSGGFTTNIDGALTSAGSKKLQKQVLEQALKALQEVPITLRDHTSMTMAIDPKLMPEAIRMIKNFRRRFCHTLETSASPKEIYQLVIAFFPLTEIEFETNKRGNSQ